MFTLVEGGKRIQIPTGEIKLKLRGNDRQAELHAVQVRVGTEARLTVGETDSQNPAQVGRLRFSKDDMFHLTAVDLPVRGHVHALATPDVIVDDATFALRLTGDPDNQLRLSGDIEVTAAHVPEHLRNRKEPPPPAPMPKSRAAAALDRTQLDLRIRSQKGAVAVELDHVPDLTVDVDFKVGGTVAQPRPDGKIKPAGVYSRIVMFLAGLFK